MTKDVRDGLAKHKAEEVIFSGGESHRFEVGRQLNPGTVKRLPRFAHFRSDPLGRYPLTAERSSRSASRAVVSTSAISR